MSGSSCVFEPKWACKFKQVFNSKWMCNYRRVCNTRTKFWALVGDQPLHNSMMINFALMSHDYLHVHALIFRYCRGMWAIPRFGLVILAFSDVRSTRSRNDKGRRRESRRYGHCHVYNKESRIITSIESKCVYEVCIDSLCMSFMHPYARRICLPRWTHFSSTTRLKRNPYSTPKSKPVCATLKRSHYASRTSWIRHVRKQLGICRSISLRSEDVERGCVPFKARQRQQRHQ